MTHCWLILLLMLNVQMDLRLRYLWWGNLTASWGTGALLASGVSREATCLLALSHRGAPTHTGAGWPGGVTHLFRERLNFICTQWMSGELILASSVPTDHFYTNHLHYSIIQRSSSSLQVSNFTQWCQRRHWNRDKRLKDSMFKQVVTTLIWLVTPILHFPKTFPF